jgi:CRISPR-associated protein Cmr1
MHRIELELSTVTPAFIGTSDPEKRAEWTAKSVRGQLRWWLRAVLGGEPGGQDKVREVEEAIFGSTSRRSAVRIMVRPCEDTRSGERAEGRPLNQESLAKKWTAPNSAPDPRVEIRLRLNNRGANPIGYLGFGPIRYDRESGETIYHRARIHPGEKLHLLLQWNGPATHLDSLRKALWCWLNLGGIGGRSRRGFGSLVCTAVHTRGGSEALIEPADTYDKFEAALQTHLASARSAKPIAAWSHFTSDTRVYVSTKIIEKDWSWEDALMAAGAWLIAFRRRYGISTDERLIVQKHDYYWLKESPAPAGGVPDRAGFGLPLPFGKPRHLVVAWRHSKKAGHDSEETAQTGRRASPLLIHVARFGTDHRLVFTHMPAQLIPTGAQIHFRGTQSVTTPEQTGIVESFLKDLETKKKIEEIVP